MHVMDSFTYTLVSINSLKIALYASFRNNAKSE